MDIIETTPKFLITLLLLLLILPALSMILGFDLGFTTQLHAQSYFYVLLYFWLSSTLSILILLLAFVDFYISKNKIMFTLGLSYLFASFFNICLTVSYKSVYLAGANLEQYEEYFWFITNTLTGSLIAFGLTLLFTRLKERVQYYMQLLLTIVLIVGTIILLNRVFFYNYDFSKVFNFTLAIAHPFALLNFLIYTYILFLYPYFSKCLPVFIAKALLYFSLIQSAQALYVHFGLMKSYDAAYIGSSFLQLFSYLLLFIFLLVYYVVNYFLVVKNQHEIRVEKDKLKQLSYQDLLTKLPNRRAFEQEGELLIAHARRYATSFALVFLDVDNFKIINDSLSHHAGDKMIQEVAGRLRQALRKNDFCARLGGDEFGVFLIGNNSKEKVAAILAKLSKVLDEPYYLEGNKIETGVSLGFASYPEDGENFLKLLKSADRAMYLNKEKRKKGV